MNKEEVYKKYFKCIKDILVRVFKDKKMLFSFILAFVFLIVGIGANLAFPFLFKEAIDLLSVSSGVSISLVLVSYGALWIVSQMTLHIRGFLTFKIEQRITFLLGKKVLSHLYSLSQNYFLNQKPGEMTNVIRRAQRDVPTLILGIFFHLLPTVMEFICVLILLISLYPIGYSLLLGATLIIFFAYTFMSMHSVLKSRESANEIDRKVDGVVTDWLSNYEAIKTFGKKDLAIDVCEKELKKRENAEIKFMRGYSLILLGQTLILGMGLIFLTYLVGQGVLKGDLSIGDFALFNGYILQFIVPISVLGQVSQDIKKAIIDMKGVIDILLTESEVKEISQPVHLSGKRFQVSFENVTFKYQDRSILENISFAVNPGETVVIVGPTGVGKSTLAKLLLRIYDPTGGHILINNVDIKHLSFQSLYENIGWVPQETYLLNDTIQNNIRFVWPEAELHDIELALHCADLLDFVKRLPEGLNTTVGDRGLKLSGGEKQRLSLARIFLKKPAICIFDEATSFLDRNTELTIQKNINAFLSDVTKLIITHRPFMLNTSDKVISLSRKGIQEADKFTLESATC